MWFGYGRWDGHFARFVCGEWDYTVINRFGMLLLEQWICACNPVLTTSFGGVYLDFCLGKFFYHCWIIYWVWSFLVDYSDFKFKGYTNIAISDVYDDDI